MLTNETNVFQYLQYFSAARRIFLRNVPMEHAADVEIVSITQSMAEAEDTNDFDAVLFFARKLRARVRELNENSHE